jgi:hypothetical protein
MCIPGFIKTGSDIQNLMERYTDTPVTVGARSEAWTVFGRSNAEIVGSNSTQGMYVYILYVYSVFVLFCV